MTRFQSGGKAARGLLFRAFAGKEKPNIIISVMAYFFKDGIKEPIVILFKVSLNLEPGQGWSDIVARMQQLEKVTLYDASGHWKNLGETRKDHPITRVTRGVMEALVLIYRDCCPWSLWILEHMAKLTQVEIPKPQ